MTTAPASEEAAYVIGCDVGGTFTDTVLLDLRTRSIREFKGLSTHDEPQRGVLRTIEQAADSLQLDTSELLARTAMFAHGTTIATNALLERRGAKSGAVMTAGFEDTLAIMLAGGKAAGRSEEELKHFSRVTKPQPVVDKSLTIAVRERVDYRGRVLLHLDEDEARAKLAALLAKGVEAVAICLLWSFRHPAHEERLAEIVGELDPAVHVTLSSDLLPRLGEYVRASTTAVNAYVAPKLEEALTPLGETLRRGGLARPAQLLKSDGGLTDVRRGVRRGAALLNSGPAGGVIAAAMAARDLGTENVITGDMGGTSFDVGLVVDGLPLTSAESLAGMHRVGIPQIAIHSIGAGGGSIAHVRHGVLEVGPQSAGADPGPACYGRGGAAATVTDANAVLGVIRPSAFDQQPFDFDLAAAEKALAQVGAEVGLDATETAVAVRKIVDERMSDLVRRITIHRGYDPRQFTLVAFGGAGPLHASALSKGLGVEAVAVPLVASAFSAFGAAHADVVVQAESAELRLTPPGPLAISGSIEPAEFVSIFGRLEERCLEELTEDGYRREDVESRWSLDMRFRYQVHELTIPVPRQESLTAEELDAVADDFVTRYERLYGTGAAFTEGGLELVTFRVEARTRPVTGAAPDRLDSSPGPADPGTIGEARVHWPDRGWLDTPVMDVASLRSGGPRPGPGLVDLPFTSVVVDEGEQVELVADAFLVLRPQSPADPERSAS